MKIMILGLGVIGTIYGYAFQRSGHQVEHFVSAGKLENAIKTLNENNINGTIILFNGVWDREDIIHKIMGNRKYILGYPVAGGNIKDDFMETIS